jgi:hypothetical protein
LQHLTLLTFRVLADPFSVEMSLYEQRAHFVRFGPSAGLYEKRKAMNGKNYFAAAIALNIVLLVIAAVLCRQFLCEAQAGGANDRQIAALLGPLGKFGPVKEVVLPAVDATGRAKILDLETGQARHEPALDDFNSDVRAAMSWIRSNGLDISCNVWPNAAACVTYDMTIVAVEGKCWEETKAEQLLGDPALAPRGHSPRRLLVLGDKRPDTYMFRTGEGTLGMLRIVGLNENQTGVKIRYKLIGPAGSLSFVNSNKRS